MRTTLFSFLIAFSGVAWADEPKSIVEIRISGSETLKAGTQELEFRLHKIRGGEEVLESDLNVVHEKKVHLFIFDLGLKEYFHVHPEYVNGAWRVSVDIPRNGYYRVWAQGQLAKDNEDFTAGELRKVVGGLDANPLAAKLEPVGRGADAESVVSFSETTFSVREMIMPTLNFERTDKVKPNITPYLGALAHVLIVSIDGDELIHVHPMEMNDSLMIHSEFQNAGDYRVWVQFVDNGVLRTVPLSFRVKEN